jgi:TonB family protein
MTPAPPHRIAAPLLAWIALAAALLVPGCKKPTPTLRAPQELQTPGLDREKLAATDAAEQRQSGVVRVDYCVDTDGRPQKVAVTEPMTPEVDALAVETVRAWTFTPATRDGEPYEFCTDVTFDVRFDE